MPKVIRPDSRWHRVLGLTHRSGQISRSELVQATGYSTFLISTACEELLNSGYLVETGSGSSTGGRPPTLLSINANRGKLVGIQMGTINARIAVTDLCGNLLCYEKVPSLAGDGPQVALPHLFSVVEKLLDSPHVPRSPLLGVGVGISGILDRNSGTTLSWPKIPQWANVPVKRKLEDHFEVLVEVEDSPRTMAMSEQRYGVAIEAPDFIYVLIGAGVGAALFLDGRLYYGTGGFAGEFGHTTVDEAGPLCSCGNHGCLEAHISASALIRRAQSAVAQGLTRILWQLCEGDVEKVSIELLAQAAEDQDRFSINLLHEAGAHLGTGLVGVVNLLNPCLIVVGGGLAAAAGRLMLPVVEQVLNQRALVQAARQVTIRLSALEESDWPRGAALLVAEQALDNIAGEFLLASQSKAG
jgi:predicted NBD/HSP70 family sugar kinase